MDTSTTSNFSIQPSWLPEPLPHNPYLTPARERMYDVQPLVQDGLLANQWYLLGAILLVGIFIYTRLSFKNTLIETIRAFFNLNMARQLYRDQEASFPVAAVLMNALFLLSGAMFAYIVVQYFEIKMFVSGFYLLLFLFGSLLVINSMRFAILKIIARVFPITREVNFYNFNIFLNAKMLGFYLILPVAMVPFVRSPGWIIYASFIVILVTFIYTYLRGLVISRDFIRFHKFHFFLYICATEIAPVAIIIKIFKDFAVLG